MPGYQIIKQLNFFARLVCKHELFEAVNYADFRRFNKARIKPSVRVFTICRKCGRVKRFCKADNINYAVFNLNNGSVYCVERRREL